MKAWTDELGEINERLTPAKIRIKKDEEREDEERAGILENYLKAKAKTLAADMPEIVEGASYGCKFSAARQSTKIRSIKAAMVAVRSAGLRKVIDIFGCGLEDLKKAVDEKAFAELTHHRPNRRENARNLPPGGSEKVICDSPQRSEGPSWNSLGARPST